MNNKIEKKVAVFECKYFEFDDDDPAGCGDSWTWCHCDTSGRNTCDCKYIYAQKFCPHYKKGKLRGKWVIGEAEKQSVKDFLKKFY